MVEKGKRVGAILDAKDGKVKFIGYGIYVGDSIPKEAVGFMADALKESKRTNPRIELDNGKVVYGCECWWGSEEKVKKMLLSYKEVEEVNIDEIRKQLQK